MKSLAIELPDSVLNDVAAAAREENVSVGEMTATIVAEGISQRRALAAMARRAARADPAVALAILDRAPDRPADAGDEAPARHGDPLRSLEPPILPDAVRRVEMAAMAKGLPVRVVKTRTIARTAAEAADAVGTTVAQIVKSLVFRGRASGRPYLLLVSGSNRVDERGVAAALGEAIERPDADFVREATGFAIGGVSPLGSLHPIATFMDETLLGFEAVWAAAGTPFHVFEADPKHLQAATGATVIRVA